MEKPIYAPLYTSKDERIVLDLEPLVYDAWTSATTDAPASDLNAVINRASLLLDGQPTAANTRKPFNDGHVMDLTLTDGRAAFVRVLAWRDEDPAKETWTRAKLLAELAVLRCLEANAPDIPVPRVLAFDDAGGLLVTTLMPGLDALHAYPNLNPSAKESSVTSWAHMAVRMFRLPAPQRFGTIEAPLKTAPYLSLSPEHSFETDKTTDLLTFFTRAISARRARSLTTNTAEDHAVLCSRLDHLLDGLKPLIALLQDTPSLSRFALTHFDPRPPNIMLDNASGKVVGIVDWEYHGSMPACMAASYPSWIRPPIPESPAYRNPKSTFTTFYLERQAERNRLSDLYEKTVEELDAEYHHCLIEGTRLRDALAWIESYQDQDGFAMDLWAKAHLPGVAGTDHRCA